MNRNIDYRLKYKELKLKFKSLIYENEKFQEQLKKSQNEYLKVAKDRNFLLDRLLTYENVSEAESTDATDIESNDEFCIDKQQTTSSNAKKKRQDNENHAKKKSSAQTKVTATKKVKTGNDNKLNDITSNQISQKALVTNVKLNHPKLSGNKSNGNTKPNSSKLNGGDKPNKINSKSNNGNCKSNKSATSKLSLINNQSTSSIKNETKLNENYLALGDQFLNDLNTKEIDSLVNETLEEFQNDFNQDKILFDNDLNHVLPETRAIDLESLTTNSNLNSNLDSTIFNNTNLGNSNLSNVSPNLARALGDQSVNLNTVNLNGNSTHKSIQSNLEANHNLSNQQLFTSFNLTNLTTNSSNLIKDAKKSESRPNQPQSILVQSKPLTKISNHIDQKSVEY